MASDLAWALLGFVVVTLFTPGPNNTMLMSSGLNFGFRRVCRIYGAWRSGSP